MQFAAFTAITRRTGSIDAPRKLVIMDMREDWQNN